jgi:hypothetical protein
VRIDQTGRSLPFTPLSVCARNGTPFTSCASGAAAPPPAHRQLLTQLRDLVLQPLAVILEDAHPVQHLAGLRVHLQRQFGHAVILRAEIVEGRLPGQRLDPAHAGRGRAVAKRHEDPDVAGLPHMGAAAKLDRIGLPVAALAGAGGAPIDTTRTSSPYFSPKQRLRAQIPRASSGVMIRVSTGEFWRMKSFTSRSTRASSSALNALPWLKSKRSRSGAFSEPRCAT